MKEIKYYVAEDGTKFNYKDECIVYEKRMRLKEYEGDFAIFDREQKKLNPLYADIEDIDYIIVKSCAAAHYIGEWFEKEGYNCPFGLNYAPRNIGAWAYDSRRDVWYHLENKIEELNKILFKLTNAE